MKAERNGHRHRHPEHPERQRHRCGESPAVRAEKNRRRVFEFCKSAAKSSKDCVKRDDPLLYEELRQIARRYKEGKRIQADEGDAQGIPCPHPEVVGVQVQNLHRVMPGIDRFFICRQHYCTPAGTFFGFNMGIIKDLRGGARFIVDRQPG